MIVYIDGVFLEENKATISISDRGFLFGDGVYITVRVRQKEPLFIEEHLMRLALGCRHFNMQMPEISRSVLCELFEKNKIDEGEYKLQIIVTGGSDERRSLPWRSGHLVATLKRAPPLPQHPLRCRLYPDYVATAYCQFKTLAHLNRYFIIDYALKHGFDDAITQGAHQELFESSFGNIFWVVDQTLYLPDPKLPLHNGVTIGQVQKIAQEKGYTVEPVRMRLTELPKDAALFRASSLAGLVPIASIDEHVFRIDTQLASEWNHILFDSVCPSSVG